MRNRPCDEGAQDLAWKASGETVDKRGEKNEHAETY